MNDLHPKHRFAAQAFDNPVRSAALAHHDGLSVVMAEFHVYLSETDDAYTLKAALPWTCKEDISVRIDDCEVSISSKVSQASAAKQNAGTPSAVTHSGFAPHSVWLDCPIDEGKTVMKYQDGVLELSLLKATASSA